MNKVMDELADKEVTEAMEMGEIKELWNQYKKMGTDLAEEAKKIPLVYDLFYKIYMIESSSLKKMEAQHKILLRDTSEYYLGLLSDREVEQLGRKKFPKRILKTDLKLYTDADEFIISSNLKLNDQQAKVDYLRENILKNLSNRGFQINQSMEWLKFIHGQS